MVGPHAFPYEISAFIYIYIYILIDWIDCPIKYEVLVTKIEK